jgi:hypothetical protein
VAPPFDETKNDLTTATTAVLSDQLSGRERALLGVYDDAPPDRHSDLTRRLRVWRMWFGPDSATDFVTMTTDSAGVEPDLLVFRCATDFSRATSHWESVRVFAGGAGGAVAAGAGRMLFRVEMEARFEEAAVLTHRYRYRQWSAIIASAADSLRASSRAPPLHVSVTLGDVPGDVPAAAAAGAMTITSQTLTVQHATVDRPLIPLPSPAPGPTRDDQSIPGHPNTLWRAVGWFVPD